MNKTLKIDGNELHFSNAIGVLKIYKDYFKKDWYADRDKQLADSIKAINFLQEYSELTDEQFTALPKEEQDAYWQGLKENKIDREFTLNTIYAMAVGGGYKGTDKEFWMEIPASELSEDSELMKLTRQFASDLSPELNNDAVKKKLNL